MDIKSGRVHELLDEIRRLIQSNERADGSFRFDTTRAVIALEFVKLELEKSIAANVEIDD